MDLTIFFFSTLNFAADCFLLADVSKFSTNGRACIPAKVSNRKNAMK
jgi:hypothetical protein